MKTNDDSSVAYVFVSFREVKENFCFNFAFLTYGGSFYLQFFGEYSVGYKLSFHTKEKHFFFLRKIDVARSKRKSESHYRLSLCRWAHLGERFRGRSESDMHCRPCGVIPSSLGSDSWCRAHSSFVKIHEFELHPYLDMCFKRQRGKLCYNRAQVSIGIILYYLIQQQCLSYTDYMIPIFTQISQQVRKVPIKKY